MEEQLLRRIKELEDENEFLKQRLGILERNRTPLGPISVQKEEKSQSVPMDTQPVSSEIDDSLLYYLKSILGYNIKCNDNTIILRSAFSFSSEDTFEIEVQGNKLMLKNTDYLREWGECFNTYIKNGRSYCAFFAAVTLELYSRKTFGE